MLVIHVYISHPDINTDPQVCTAIYDPMLGVPTVVLILWQALQHAAFLHEGNSVEK